MVESQVGAGTTVTLILPCSPNAATVLASGAERNSTSEAPACGTVMVVDDNEDVGAFAEALLAELGYAVVRATSGEEALALFDERPIDLMFTDVVMPGMSGIELADELRRRSPALPVVLTTGYSDRLSDDESGYPVLFKPYKSDALVAAIGEALAKRC